MQYSPDMRLIHFSKVDVIESNDVFDEDYYKFWIC